MPTTAEILALINDLPAEEHAAFATAFQNDAGAVVKSVRSKVFAAGKTEGSSAGKAATSELATAKERVTELETELAEVKAKQPDAAAIEKRVRDQLQPKLDTAVRERDEARGTLRERDKTLTQQAFLQELSAAQEDGTRVNPAYLRVAKVDYADRFQVGEDGRVRVLQIGSEVAYDAADAAEAAKLLARDARKQVPADFIVSGADGGAGSANRSSYAGARETPGTDVDALVAQKRASGAYAL